MKERPILFSAPMIRAILAGTKSQTRRIVKTVGNDGGFVIVEQDDGSLLPYRSDDGESMFVTVRERGKEYQNEIQMVCPYGAAGTRLWVREAFAIWQRGDSTARGMPYDPAIVYRADDETYTPDIPTIAEVEPWRWRPSIHMPRRASRITLEVTGIKVERLQGISEDDALAEGVDRFPGLRHDDDAAAFNRIGPVDNDSFPIARYAALWESINGPGSWDANPWVFVISFRRI